MLQATTPTEWDAGEDRDLLRQFIESRTGKRLLAKLAEEAPGLHGGGPTNDILIRSGEVRGFSLAISYLIELAYPPKALIENPPAGDYPLPEDDSAWDDKRKIKTE